MAGGGGGGGFINQNQTFHYSVSSENPSFTAQSSTPHNGSGSHAVCEQPANPSRKDAAHGSARKSVYSGTS